MRTVVGNDSKYSDHIKNSLNLTQMSCGFKRNKILELMDQSSNDIAVEFKFSIVEIPEQDSFILSWQ